MIEFDLTLFYFLLALILLIFLIPSLYRAYEPYADSITKFLRWKHRRYTLASILEKENVKATGNTIRLIAGGLLFTIFGVLYFQYMAFVIRNYESHILEFVSVLITSSSVLIGFSRSAATTTKSAHRNLIQFAPTLGAFCIIASITSIILEGATLSSQAVGALEWALLFLTIEALIVAFA